MISVLVVNEHQIIRHGLKMALESDPKVKVVGECSDASEAAELARQLKPDVVVLDLSSTANEAVGDIAQITGSCRGTRVLALTLRTGAHYIKRLKEAGAMGCLTKDSSPEDFADAVKSAAKGEFYLQTEVAARAFMEFLREMETKPVLSDREVAVVRLAAEGCDANEVSARLSITPRTVQTHLYHAMKKLDIHSRHELVQYAIREGIIAGPR